MNDQANRWIARLVPVSGQGIDSLLETPIGLDIWEREPNALIVTATESQLREIERRRLAWVERLETVKAYLSRMESNPNA